MGWIKLQTGNDWGREYLAIKALSKGGFAEYSRGIDPPIGAACSILWPDGTTDTVKIEYIEKEEEVSDHGHVTKVSYTIPGFYHYHHGCRCWFRLSRVKVRRKWAKLYTPKKQKETA